MQHNIPEQEENPSHSEGTGHAKNVENWQKMIAGCTGMGGGYQPVNVDLQLAALTALLNEVTGSMDNNQTDLVPWKNKVADRENIYKGLSSAHDADTWGI